MKNLLAKRPSDLEAHLLYYCVLPRMTPPLNPLSPPPLSHPPPTLLQIFKLIIIISGIAFMHSFSTESLE
jgi:hypothetical protein